MGAEGAILEPPVEEVVDGDVQEQEGPQEVPSVFSVINRYLVSAADVSPPAEDDSRVLRLFSSSGAIVEVNLAPPLCEFISTKLVEVPVIAEDEGEVVEDAGPEE